MTSISPSIYNTMGQFIQKIYLHWTATHYQWAEPGHYHTVILGDGTCKKLTPYQQALKEHTAGRNPESVALSLSCMGSSPWIDYPPTPEQIESLCQEVAQIAYQLGWEPADITIDRILTHAEAAANRDYPLDIARQVSNLPAPQSTPQGDEYLKRAHALGLPHENYGPTDWSDKWPGGFAERWDLLQLRPQDSNGSGGIVLRDRIKTLLATQLKTHPRPKPLGNPLKILTSKGKPLTLGRMMPDNRCYARIDDLARAYGITATWHPKRQMVNLIHASLTPKTFSQPKLIPHQPQVTCFWNLKETDQGELVIDPQHLPDPLLRAIAINQSIYLPVTDFCNLIGIGFKLDRTLPAITLEALPEVKTTPPAKPIK